MPRSHEVLRKRLQHEPLPTSLPIRLVIQAMDDMGYTLDIKGSHHHFRKPGTRRITFSVHNKKITAPGVKELANLMREQGTEPTPVSEGGTSE